MARAVLAAFAAVADSSRFVDVLKSVCVALPRAWDASATGTGASQGLKASNQLVSGSRTVGIILGIARPTRQAVDRAAVTRLAKRTETVVLSSWLYRWLTAEPEPEVIVIDLRETLSLGPVIALLDELVRALLPASYRSAIVSLTVDIYAAMKQAPVRAASLVLSVAIATNLGVTLAIGEPTRASVIARVGLLGLAALGTRIMMTWDELLETRLFRLLIAALEPPEPPEDRQRRK